ncbi:MAG: hypothetical protein WD490_05445 [Opitutales bacterium]
MKKINQINGGCIAASFLAIGLLTSGISAIADAAEQNGHTPSGSLWADRAEEAQDAFFEKYWNAERSMFDNRYPCDNCNRTFNYWWQAHAVDVLVDGYERAGDQRYLERAQKLYEGIVERNNGITIDYYDDMLWMGLALLRVYQHTGDVIYKDAVHELWEDIKTGWKAEFIEPTHQRSGDQLRRGGRAGGGQ